MKQPNDNYRKLKWTVNIINMLKYQVIKSVTSVLVVFILKLTVKFG